MPRHSIPMVYRSQFQRPATPYPYGNPYECDRQASVSRFPSISTATKCGQLFLCRRITLISFSLSSSMALAPFLTLSKTSLACGGPQGIYWCPRLQRSTGCVPKQKRNPSFHPPSIRRHWIASATDGAGEMVSQGLIWGCLGGSWALLGPDKLVPGPLREPDSRTSAGRG